jgi:pyruvate,water dikinase
VSPEKITDADVAAEIHNLTKAYLDGKDYFVDKLAEAVSIVAAALP